MLKRLVARVALAAFFTTCSVVPSDGASAEGAQGQSEILFANVVRASGVAFEKTMSWGSTWVDHDSDGDEDLFASRHWRTPRFYENRGEGRYSLFDETFFSGPHSVFDRHTCSWGEANGDGRVDFYCDSGAQKGEGTGPNQLWIQSGDSFVNRSDDYRVKDRLGRSRSVSWLDYDSDGDLDIFVGNKLREGQPNVLFRNDRGVFSKPDVGLGEEMNALNSTWSDWDNDGDPDLVVTNYRPDATRAYQNDGGSFVETSLPGVTGTSWNSAVWGDFDGDGWTDLHLVSNKRSVIMKNGQGTLSPVHMMDLARGASSAWLDVDNDGDLDSFVVQSGRRGVNRPDFFLINDAGSFSALRDDSFRGPTAGFGETASVADHDRDGRLDLFVTNGALVLRESRNEGKWILLENRSAAGSWIRLRLDGDPWNPWGFGAHVLVDTDGVDYSREITDGMTFRAQHQVGNLLLGVGAADQASIRVEWGDGTEDCLSASAGSSVVVSKGDSLCPQPFSAQVSSNRNK